ncbi:MAG TPA: tripartite tricarboxylate transporter TctB family protein [Candidatus Limnocylindrales bacterium]|nr:tripartite tricarboxylate transporter TctB family protein [Candidatus Limnocylindrales bacterium]
MTVEEGGPGAAQGGGLLGPRLVAVALLVLAAILIVSAIGIAQGGGYSVIGPATIPFVVAVGLLVLGAIFALRTTVVPDTDLATQAVEEERATHWPTVGLTALALVGYALALDGFALGAVDVPGLGYIVATGVFLPVTARILGSRSPMRDVIVGLGIGIVIYFGFTEFLGVRLPAGILDPLL